MLVYYFVLFIVSNHYLLFWVSNSHNSVTVQNRTHVYMNYFEHKDLGNHLLQLCPKVVKHLYILFIITKLSCTMMRLLFLQNIHTVCTYLLFWWWIVVRTHPKIRGVFIAVVIQPFTHVVSKVETPVVIWAELEVNDNKFGLWNLRLLTIQPQQNVSLLQVIVAEHDWGLDTHKELPVN